MYLQTDQRSLIIVVGWFTAKNMDQQNFKSMAYQTRSIPLLDLLAMA